VERDTITIRRATRRDIPSLLQLYGSFATHDDDPDGLSLGAADAIFDRIDADANQALLVAEQDLRIIGTLVLVVVQNLAHCGNPWAIVENVAVHERARGQGLGTLLMEEAVRRALLQTRTFRTSESHRFPPPLPASRPPADPPRLRDAPHLREGLRTED